MPFDWNSYFTLADELRQAGDEAKYRSAISRSYYCAFNLATAYIKQIDPSYKYDGHENLWTLFAGINGKEEIMNYGERARQLRVKADYRDNINNPRAETTMAMMNVQFIINLLK